MAIESSENAEVERLRERVEEQERAHAESIKRANAALAASQDRSYWLERWQVDLNELMRRPGASEARAAMRALRGVYRSLNHLRNQIAALPERTHDVRRAVEEERQVAKADEGDPFSRTISPDPPLATPVTDILYDRLDPSAAASVEARLTPAEQAMWDSSPPAVRRRLVLAFGTHHGVPEVLAASGLSSATPPVEVHAIKRGSAAAGGSTYLADMVVEAAMETGLVLTSGQAGLDFGCSSGRVVRVLAAAFPEVEWHGCDPLAEPIAWAQANLPDISFTRSPERPPLQFADTALDLVLAISIWSHFGEQAALAWLAEMARILKPGGRLVLTTHGPHSIAHAAAQGLRDSGQLEEIERALYRDGFWFTNEFGATGDHGLRDAQWGTAFLSPEWLLRRTGSVWRVGAYHPGRLQDNQDLYVLELR